MGLLDGSIWSPSFSHSHLQSATTWPWQKPPPDSPVETCSHQAQALPQVISSLVFCISRVILKDWNTIQPAPTTEESPVLCPGVFQVSRLWAPTSLQGWWLQVSAPGWLPWLVLGPTVRLQPAQAVHTMKSGSKACWSAARGWFRC